MIERDEILTRMADGARLLIDSDPMTGDRCFYIETNGLREIANKVAARELFEAGQITTDDTCACGVSEYRLVLNK